VGKFIGLAGRIVIFHKGCLILIFTRDEMGKFIGMAGRIAKKVGESVLFPGFLFEPSWVNLFEWPGG